MEPYGSYPLSLNKNRPFAVAERDARHGRAERAVGVQGIIGSAKRMSCGGRVGQGAADAGDVGERFIQDQSTAELPAIDVIGQIPVGGVETGGKIEPLARRLPDVVVDRRDPVSRPGAGRLETPEDVQERVNWIG